MKRSVTVAAAATAIVAVSPVWLFEQKVIDERFERIVGREHRGRVRLEWLFDREGHHRRQRPERARHGRLHQRRRQRQHRHRWSTNRHRRRADRRLSADGEVGRAGQRQRRDAWLHPGRSRRGQSHRHQGRQHLQDQRDRDRGGHGQPDATREQALRNRCDLPSRASISIESHRRDSDDPASPSCGGFKPLRAATAP